MLVNPSEAGSISKSGDDLRDQLTMYIGEPHGTAVECISQAFVIESQHVQNGGVEIEDRNWLFGNLIAELIAGANDLTAFDPGSSHPDGECVRIVIPPDA